MIPKTKKTEFGDFQTPAELSKDVTEFVKTIFPNPSYVIEPTCGMGSFIHEAIKQYGGKAKYLGFDINKEYIDHLNNSKRDNIDIEIEVVDFFKKDWKFFFKHNVHGNLLVIGNPPWVTNSSLGALDSTNLPIKSNFQRLTGFQAKTGKANFDIAEWMLINLIENVQNYTSCIAMLCKTSTARKVLKHLWLHKVNVYNSSLHIFDPKKHFGVSVDACLFITHTQKGKHQNTATIYSDFSFNNEIATFGIRGKELVANINDYLKYKEIEGEMEYYKWRSGLKHDASMVMELTKFDGFYINGYGKKLSIEDDYVYPLLKSSDLANGRLIPNKYVILTQQNIEDDTSHIRQTAPKTWDYLKEYEPILNNRKSIIYKNRPKFSIFGIGNYSFSLWKVAISGLYKNLQFSVVGNCYGKPTMVDDTCYFIPCGTKNEADLVCELLNSEICKKFLSSLIFFDSKRPINIDILKRIDLKKLAELYKREYEIVEYLSNAQVNFSKQRLLVFEDKEQYQTNTRK
jgi:hypothetical protein